MRTTAGWAAAAVGIAAAVALGAALVGSFLHAAVYGSFVGPVGDALLVSLVYLPSTVPGTVLYLLLLRSLARTPSRRRRGTAFALSPVFSSGFLIFVLALEPNELLTPAVIYLLVVPAAVFGAVVPLPPVETPAERRV